MINLSVSEINSYLTCRRAWDISSANRQSLKHKVSPKIYLTIGSAVHAAIEAQSNGDDPYEAFEEFVNVERADRRMAYEEAVGVLPWDSEMEEFESGANLARSLVHQYFDHYGTENPYEDLGLRIVASEVPFNITMSDDVNFVGTFDHIAVDLETESQFYLIENKTSGRTPDFTQYERSNQHIGYNWAFWVLTGQKPAGTVYNIIMKRLITEPKILKSGKLSVDKSASVTYKSFMKALNYGNHDPVQYTDYITMLHEREQAGDSRFFVREIFRPTKIELLNWKRDVLDSVIYEILGHPVIIPNRSACDRCFVSDLCTAMDRDDDVELLVSQRYQVGTYGTQQAVRGITPTNIASLEDLQRTLEEYRANRAEGSSGS